MANGCEWCGSQNIHLSIGRVFWEMPDGTRAIEITETPTLFCHDCKMVYQEEKMVKDIENQLFLIDTKQIGNKISFHDLMNKPRILKKNYFDFSS
ncbi:MAG: YokU family protein [Bacillota bacterium]|nr:YokU family protein [Bacillota bacterium]